MSRKVLIIDDSNLIRTQLRSILANMGFMIHEAKDGPEGIEQLRKLKDELTLVVTDYNMPNMTGIEMIENYREEFGEITFPILILTTEKSLELIKKAKQIGVKGWLAKPFNDQIIEQVVTKLISQ